MKRILTRFTAFVMMFSILCGALPVLPVGASETGVSASGKCGENLYWTLSNDYSVLTIYGTGTMDDFHYY